VWGIGDGEGYNKGDVEDGKIRAEAFPELGLKAREK
jgi:hypothetical protein